MKDDLRYFDAAIQDGKIYERKFKDNPQVGVTLEIFEQLEREHNELIDSYNEYQQLLIKHKLIKEPMTPEEQVLRLLDINEKQAVQFDALSQRVNKLTESLYEYINSATHGGGQKPNGAEGTG